MKKLYMVSLLALITISLSGCEKGEVGTGDCPYITIQNNCLNYSSYNQEIPIGGNYIMNQSHSYDIIETEQGIDVIIHFIDKAEDAE